MLAHSRIRSRLGRGCRALMILAALAEVTGPNENGSSSNVAFPSTVSAALPPRQMENLLPGLHPLTIRDPEGKQLRFTISVPEGYSAKKPTPLVLALHYGGRVTPFYGGGMIQILVGPALAELGAIIVAPDAIVRGWRSEPNEKAVLHILELVEDQFNIDRNKTLVTGFSMGAAGTWHFAAHHHQRFSAAIPISGRVPDEVDCSLPTYVIHSRDDGLIPLDPVEQSVKKLKSKGCDVHLEVIEGITHFQTGRFVQPFKQTLPWIRKVWKQREE